MTAQEAIDRLEPALSKDENGCYRFACRKASLVLRLLDKRVPLRFAPRDQVGFRTDDRALTVEELHTGVVRMQFAWKQIESLAAGEPEIDNGPLFQG